MFERIWLYTKTFEGRVVIALVIIALGCAWGIQQSYSTGKNAKDAVEAVKAESRERRDQQCKQQELLQDQAAKQVIATYQYIDGISKKDIKSNLNQAVLRQAPDTYARAQASVAPQFCFERGIGLKEPRVALPQERDFRHLIIKK